LDFLYVPLFISWHIILGKISNDNIDIVMYIFYIEILFEIFINVLNEISVNFCLKVNMINDSIEGIEFKISSFWGL